MGQIEMLAEEVRELKRLLNFSHAHRSLVHPLDGTFPSTSGHQVIIDLARVADVNPSTGTVNVVCLHLGTAPSDVQWLSPMLDPKTGNGMYFVPKPGMFGLYMNIGGADYFWGMAGLTETFGQNLFLNFREPLPEGGVGIRTSAETKSVWGPNLILIQAANFCKIALQRASKKLSAIFYSLDLTSLGGFMRWVTDVTATGKFSNFTFSIRNKLAPAKGTKSDPARNIHMKVGADSANDTNLFRLLMTKVTGPDEGNALETEAVGRLRKGVRNFLGGSGIDSPSVIKTNPVLNAAFGGFVLNSDTTVDLMTESIVAAATFVHQARPDAINGIVDLAPPADSFENLDTGKVLALNGRPATSLSSDLEVFIEANRLEIRKDPETGESITTFAAPLVSAARNGLSDESGVDLIDLLLKLSLDTEGRFRVDQSHDVPPTQPGKTVTPGLNELGMVWDLISGFRLRSQKGPVDIDAGKGLRIQFQDGAVIVGSKVAGITITPDGDVEIRGRNVRIRTVDERPAYETDAFRKEEDAYEDFLETEDQTYYGPADKTIAKILRPKYYTITQTKNKDGSITETIREKTSPHGTPPPESFYPRPLNKNGDLPEQTVDKFGRQTNPIWKRYFDNARKWQRDYNWDARRLFLLGNGSKDLPGEKVRGPKRAAELRALQDAYKTKLGTRSDAQLAKALLTDTGTLLEVTSHGINLTANSSIHIRSGVSIVRQENNRPTPETTGTTQQFKDSALNATGVPDFKVIDSDVAKTAQ